MNIPTVLCAMLACCLMAGCRAPAPDRPASPPGLGYHAMAYDAESHVIVVFGGQLKDYSMQSVVSTTWVYDCIADMWRKMNPSVTPPAAAGHAMAYDSAADRVLLFCGQTWVYDYNADSWKQKNPAVQPIGAFGCSMAYDAESDRTVLFGVPSGDTWVYDLNSDAWTAMHPPVSPPARQYQSMAYDTQSDRVVLFGGAKAGTSALAYSKVYDDTWVYDYNSNLWEEREPFDRPEKRVYHAMTYDAGINRVVLSGGWAYDSGVDTGSRGWNAGADNGGKTEIWLYDFESDSWSARAVATPGDPTSAQLRKHAMAFDAKDRSIFIYGGITGPPTPGGEPPFRDELLSFKLR